MGRRVETLAGEWTDRGTFETNLHRGITSTTVRVATEFLFGEDIGTDRADRFHGWVQAAGTEFEFGLDGVSPDWLPSRISPEFREAAAGIRELSEDIVERCRREMAENEAGTNMLTMLVAAGGNDGTD